MPIPSGKTFHQNGSVKMQLVDGNDFTCPQKNILEPIHMPQKENGRFLEKHLIFHQKKPCALNAGMLN